MRSKVTIVGGGNVGASCAQCMVQKGYADVVVLDAVEGIPQGKSLDMLQSMSIDHLDASVIGTNSYEDTAGSDVVVITAGIGRKPGMSRDDLVQANKKVIKDVTKNAVKYSPNCIFVMVTNPLDAMVWLALRETGFPRNRIVGQSGALDTGRLKAFIAQELRVSTRDISACIIGAHGDTMVPVARLCTVGGIPITELLPQETVIKLFDQARNGGAEIVSLLKSSAFYAPAAATALMIDAILLDRKEIIPCSAYLDGEYGMKDVSLGVPVKLGRNGIEQIIEIELSPEEKIALEKSAEAVKEIIEVMRSGG